MEARAKHSHSDLSANTDQETSSASASQRIRRGNQLAGKQRITESDVKEILRLYEAGYREDKIAEMVSSGQTPR